MTRFAQSRSRPLETVALMVALLAATAGSVDAADLTGQWTGSWQSCTTGHRGPLQATFCPISPAQYRVDFSGRFFKLLPFRYSVTLNVVADDGQTVELAGSSYLGRLFGTFHYQGQATGGRFTAHYSSCKDRGQFALCRSGPCPRAK